MPNALGGSGRDDDPVLDAVFMLFMRSGYGGFSMGDVAQTAGVPERDVTGRGARAELVMAALERAVPAIVGCPDTGTWRGDLLQIVLWQMDLLRMYGPVIDRSMQSAQDSEEYATTAREATNRRLVRYRPMFERAIARGEVDPGLDYDSALDLMLGQVYARYLTGRPTEPEDAQGIVDLVLQGLTASSERS